MWITAALTPVRLAPSRAGRVHLAHGRVDVPLKLTEPIAEVIQPGPVRRIAVLHQVQEDHHVIPLVAKDIETRVWPTGHRLSLK